MAHGSAYSAVKAALVTQLEARAGLSGVAVSYQAPVNVPDVRSMNGSWETVFCDDAEGDFNDVVFCAGGLRFDETYTQTIVIQVLRPSSIGTQQSADERVQELLYEVSAEIAGQQSWDFASLGLDQFDYLFLTPASQRWVPGRLEGTAGHAARCELGVEVRSRRSFS